MNAESICIYIIICILTKFHLFNNGPSFQPNYTSLVAQLVKNLTAMQEIEVRSLGQKEPLEKEMATLQ